MIRDPGSQALVPLKEATQHSNREVGHCPASIGALFRLLWLDIDVFHLSAPFIRTPIYFAERLPMLAVVMDLRGGH